MQTLFTGDSKLLLVYVGLFFAPAVVELILFQQLIIDFDLIYLL